MSSVDSVRNSKALQRVAYNPPPEETSSEKTSDSATSEFDSIMKGILRSAEGSNVSEEELFSALVGERIHTTKGAELGKKYDEMLQANKASMTKSNGYVPVEAAASETLKQMQLAGDLTEDEANQIYSDSFAGAQLDDKKNFLYDGQGGPGDATIAVESMEAALITARQMMEKFATGEEVAKSRSLNEVTFATSLTHSGAGAGVSMSSATIAAGEANPNDGPGGFLWKPVSNNQGKLAVLANSTGPGDIAGVLLRDINGNVIEEGKYSSFEEGREKYNFNNVGSAYASNLTVEVTMADGRLIKYLIEDPSKRYD